jgi:hypothetical protein
VKTQKTSEDGAHLDKLGGLDVRTGLMMIG